MSRRSVLVAVILMMGIVFNGSAQSTRLLKERVTFKSGNLTLVGFLFRPAGNGPFPALLWNHGSEQNPGTGPQFDSVAALLAPSGYVVFAPMRRGHGKSEGNYISDDVAKERAAHGASAAATFMVHQMESAQLDDQLAGLEYLKHLPYVDTTRIAVAGCSYGGIETLLAAERGAGLKAAVAISPAALSWNGNPALRARLVKAVGVIHIPVLLIQPPKDATLEPSYVLGAEFERLKKPYGLEIFPPFGSEKEQGHCFGGAAGFHVFGESMRTFLANIFH